MSDLVPVIPTGHELKATHYIAETIANTEFVPSALRGKTAAIMAAIFSGREIGIGPMQALAHINIIKGKPSPSAELQVALVRKQGHSITGEATDDHAIVKGKRSDTGDEMTFTFTREMAERAGLTGKDNWQHYPEAMLWSRAVSQLCRMLFPDCLSGLSHNPDELGSEEYVPDPEAKVEVVPPPGVDVVTGEITDAEVVPEHKPGEASEPDSQTGDATASATEEAADWSKASRKFFRLVDELLVPGVDKKAWKDAASVAVKEHYRVDSLKAISAEQLNRLVDALRADRDRLAKFDAAILEHLPAESPAEPQAEQAELVAS